MSRVVQHIFIANCTHLHSALAVTVQWLLQRTGSRVTRARKRVSYPGQARTVSIRKERSSPALFLSASAAGAETDPSKLLAMGWLAMAAKGDDMKPPKVASRCPADQPAGMRP